MGFVIIKFTQGLASSLIFLFFGFAVAKFGKVIFNGFKKEKK